MDYIPPRKSHQCTTSRLSSNKTDSVRSYHNAHHDLKVSQLLAGFILYNIHTSRTGPVISNNYEMHFLGNLSILPIQIVLLSPMVVDVRFGDVGSALPG